MTQAEFAQGWKLLINQPWGWRYRTLTDGKPSEESRLQLELYYSKLHWATAQAWFDVVNLYVEGTEWPSIQALKQSLQQVNPRYVKTLSGPVRNDGHVSISEDDAKAILARFGVHPKGF